jgi:hypothetical protein
VFTSVGGKTEVLKLAIDWAIVGDDEPVPMLERPHIKAMQHEPDARRILARSPPTHRGRHAELARIASHSKSHLLRPAAADCFSLATMPPRARSPMPAPRRLS